MFCRHHTRPLPQGYIVLAQYLFYTHLGHSVVVLFLSLVVECAGENERKKTNAVMDIDELRVVGVDENSSNSENSMKCKNCKINECTYRKQPRRMRCR